MSPSSPTPQPPSFPAALGCLEAEPGTPSTARLGGHRLASAFQPIFSLSHGRVVGHEALLRASDATGRALSPPDFFDVDSFDELLWRDRVVRTLHAANFARERPQAQWLFLNMPPQVFLHAAQGSTDEFMSTFFAHFGLHGPQLVFEVLENAAQNDGLFGVAVERIRARGCLIALDDFGAGHSNFDRVWRLRPDIVKIDRSLVARAALDLHARRVVVQMVSLLHECGALVLMEGVETEPEAFVALEADADMVQGCYFARPRPDLRPDPHGLAVMSSLWAGLAGRWRDEHTAYRDRVAPYRNGIGYAASLLCGGRSLAEAVHTFLQLPEAEVCYLLDSEGRQIGGNCWGERLAQVASPAFEPLRDARGARWSRRPYFRRAVQSVGRVQVTRPYRSLHGTRLCVTVSAAFLAPSREGGELHVVCGDVSWEG